MQLTEHLNVRRAKHDGKRPLLMTHVVCGYPSFDHNWKALEVMQQFDVDLVELQFPFSEPSADGPTFVRANQKAIELGVSVADCFDFMNRVSEQFDFRTLMMGYYNTAFKLGHEPFLRKLSHAGACGFILPDLPIEEATELHQIAHQYDIDPIVLMTPTNDDERLTEIAQVARGFIYVVARKGVTGASTRMNQDLLNLLQRCRTHTSLPLAVGFGVNQRDDIEFINEHADIAIIGTAALKAWERSNVDGLTEFFNALL